MEASPETISLTEYYPCRTDKAPADSSRGTMAGGQRSSEPVDLEASQRQCGSSSRDAAAGHGGTLERMHTVSSTETSGYVDAASSPTAPVSSPAASIGVAPSSATGDTMTDDARAFMYPSAADGLLLLPQRGANCSRRPDGAFICDKRLQGEEQQRPAALCRPMYQRRDMVDGKVAGRGGGHQAAQGGPGACLLQGQSTAYRNDGRRNDLLRRNRKEVDDEEEEEEVDEDEDDEEEETCSSSEEDGDYWQREDSSMFARRPSKNHPQRSTVVIGPAGHRATSPTTDAAHEQGQGHGQFLGKATQSAWLKWSHERRASFKRRVEFMEQRQTELQRVRLSSPIRKARKESVRFVAKELEQEHLAVIDPAVAVGPEDETSVYGQHPAFPFDIPPSTKKKKVHTKKADSPSGVETRLSLAQWNTLVAFWEHRLFVKLRCCGLLLGLAALACGVSSLANNQWSTYENHTMYGSAHFSLWKICSCVHFNCSNIEHTKWQISVIGLVVFSTTFGSLGLALSLGGFLTSSLPKKIYYYHSAGEIDLLCCLSCVVTSVLYPMTIESERLTDGGGSSHELGLGYFLVCSSAGGFCLAASCLCFDDMLRSVAKLFCRRPRTQRSHGKLQVLRLCQSKS